MAEQKAWKKYFGPVFDYFKNDQGKFDFVAITLTILNVIATFFFLTSMIVFVLDFSDLGAMIRTGIALYVLFMVTLLIFMVITTTLKTKFIRLNINIFLLYLLVFQLPTMNLWMAILFLLLAATLYYYPIAQQNEEDYAKKVNIKRRTLRGVYLIIFISSIIMSYGATRSIEKYTMNELIDQTFTDNGTVHSYIHNVYDKYFSTEEFYRTLDEIDYNIKTTPEQVLDSINKLPPQTLDAFNNVSPQALENLQKPEMRANLELIRTQVLDFTSQLRDSNKKYILIDRLVNIGSGQVKTLLAPYDFYFRFYVGYSIFALLIIASPFLLIILSWLVLAVFKLMSSYGYVRIAKEKMDVEYIEKA